MSGLLHDEAETVYDLIPPPAQAQRKKPLYKSQFPGTLPPSYSTLALRNTSKPGVSNVGGDVLDTDIVGSSHTVRKPAATMGARAAKPDPATFMPKRAREPRMPTPQAFTRTNPDDRKPAVPSRAEKPVMGLKTGKNFITANAIEAILAVPKKTTQEAPRFVQKPEYGRVPQYLDRVKREINEEYEYVQRLQAQASNAGRENVRALTDDEKAELIASLRAKWEELNRAYQTLRFSSDAPAHFQRKERLEQQIAQIEKDIEKLSKKVVYVHEDL